MIDGAQPTRPRGAGHRRIGIACAISILAATMTIPAGVGTSHAEPVPTVEIDGNRIMVDGQPFVPRGFNSIALLDSEWCTQTRTRAAAAGLTAEEIDLAARRWNANTLRFQVSQPVLAGEHGVEYAQQLRAGVGLALDAGFVVIVSMQDQSRACGPASPLPGPATVAAWTTLLTSTDLGTNPAVMLELFNEPQNSESTTPTADPTKFTWVDWLSGGRQIEPSAGHLWSAYTPVGHQDLVNLIRTDLGASNVLLADGARKAAHLEGMPMLDDPLPDDRIAYAVHPYYYTPGTSAWDLRWGNLARTHVVIATEWNYTAGQCGTAAQTMAPQLFEYMRTTVNVGVLGHSLDAYDDLTTGPSLLPSKCGTASPGAGADFFQHYMSTFADPVVLSSPAGLQVTGPSDGALTLSWDAPALDDGMLAGYGVRRNGVLRSTVTARTYVDTDVQPGQSYTYTVEVVDVMWRTSAPSESVTVLTVPSAPAIGTATAADASATARWLAPARDGGSALVRYDITVLDHLTGASVGEVRSVDPAATSALVTDLANGVPYRFHVVAVNGVGASSPSASSNVVTPSTPATAPAAPAIGTATAGSASATVRWTAPVSNGGAAITRYDVVVLRASTGAQVGAMRSAPGSATSLTVTGLTNGIAYRFQVIAVNVVGASTRSASSNTVTPAVVATVPGTPIIGTPTRGSAGGALTAVAVWSAPASTGGSPITGYRVHTMRMSSSSSSATVLSSTTSALLAPSARKLTMTLASGNYRFQVVAINAIGTSARSAMSANVVPR